MAQGQKEDFLSEIVKILQKNPNTPLTAKELADLYMQKHPEQVERRIQKSHARGRHFETKDQLRNAYSAELSSRKGRLLQKYPQIELLPETYPQQFCYEAQFHNTTPLPVPTTSFKTPVQKSSTKLTEQDLYPILRDFLKSQAIRSKRVDEKRSSNTKGAGGNQWLYPDLVGFEDLTHRWDIETKNCVKEYSVKKTKLWSFEVKNGINRSTVRESFFQTVSNSSWANLAYLVSPSLQGKETFEELRILSSVHGIGYIELNIDAPEKSEIKIPARERLEIDWDTVDRLLCENKDFKEYIIKIRQFYQTGDPGDFD